MHSHAVQVQMEINMQEEKGEVKAYVDGSFNPQLAKYAFGCVLFHPDGEIEEICGSGNSEQGIAQRNVAGEMIASMLSVQWAIRNGYGSIDIFYDYAGIEAWVTGEWKAKNELTQKYRDTMRGWQEKVSIYFHKVPAHSKVEYNERADKLAKMGLEKEPGLPSIQPRQ